MPYIPPRTKLFNEHLVFDDSQIDEIPGEFYLYYVRLTTEFLSPAFEMTILSEHADLDVKNQQTIEIGRAHV